MPTKSNKKIVNKLVLIGNGFDLALDLKTKYEDFLFWYLKNSVLKGLVNFSPVLIDQRSRAFHYFEDDLFLFYNERNHIMDQIQTQVQEYKCLNDIKKFLKDNIYGFYIKLKSSLLDKIYSESNSGWVDIEKSYFELLKAEIDKEENDIDKLNKDLKTLSSNLKEYLIALNYNKLEDEELAIKHTSQFIKKVDSSDLIEIIIENEKLQTDHIYFLNFNYTPSLEIILNSAKTSELRHFKDKISINQIHGNINAENDSLIFGYGDEMDIDYKKIEQLNDNRFFDNIKSFKYAENKNYRDLLRFVNAEAFQVVVYGHSCGLSDRLMLNEIFEHENCISIKIYFYNRQEFINKTMDISRHFNSNKLMRKKIVEFDSNNLIPQLEK